MALISFTDKGLYCAQGDFYIDPWKPVNKAIITHAHSDHARWGSNIYLCHQQSKQLLLSRLGNIAIQTLNWHEIISVNGVEVSLYPAGHIIGSAQIKVSYKGETWVASGDYKTEDDTLSTPFEPVKCNYFITESTFGLPIYQWQPQQEIFTGIATWVMKNNTDGISSVLLAYSLGKAQRVLLAVATLGIPIFVHGAVWNMHEALLKDGWQLPAVQKLSPDTPKSLLKGCVIIAPPSADGSPWLRKFNPYKVAVCSGWMQVRGNSRRRNVDAAFVLSDHADWDGLLKAVHATEAEKVYVTHGFQSVFSRYLNEIGIASEEVKTAYGTEEETDKLLENIEATIELPEV